MAIYELLTILCCALAHAKSADEQCNTEAALAKVNRSGVAALQIGAIRSGKNALLLHSFEETCIPPGMRAVTTVNGFKMVVLGDNDIVSKSFAASGYWEIRQPEDMIPAEMRGRISLPENGTLLDIGANIGDYTMLFASKGYNVIAVEPMTRNRRAMEATLCLNPQFKDKVKIVPAALVAPAEVAGNKCIVKSTNYQMNMGNGFLTCGRDIAGCKAGDTNCEEVPVKTLSTALSELNVKRIDVVKIDVENYECHIFAGGESMFTKYRPTLLQVETMWGNASECVAEIANKFSYKSVKVGENTEMVDTKKRMLFLDVPE